MARRRLAQGGGTVFHVLNRSVRRAQLFFGDADYAAFEGVLHQALERIPTRLLAYCVMPNHWHLVVWPQADEIPRFMHWLTSTHTRRWHLAHGTRGTGHVYQNRYYAVPVATELHLLRVLRYVERNALRAKLVERAEDWRWCSLWRRCNFCNEVPLATWPILRPADWVAQVNEQPVPDELVEIQEAVRNGRPLGAADWTREMADRFALRLRPVGRPRK